MTLRAGAQENYEVPVRKAVRKVFFFYKIKADRMINDDVITCSFCKFSAKSLTVATLAVNVAHFFLSLYYIHIL